MIDLKIEMVAASELVPYANNAKVHSDKQVEEIANSIREFGFDDPVAVWTNGDGKLEIVEGHGRILACERLGIDTVPIIRLDHLTDEQRKAYTHIHNQTTLSSGFDLEKLKLDLDELDYDWDAFGFDTIDLDDYEVELPQEDDYSEPEEIEPAVKFGQRWRLGKHILMCGDSTDPYMVADLMSGTVADCMVTDPPYNVDVTGCTDEKLKIANDNMSDNEFRAFIDKAMLCGMNALKPGGSFYIWHASRTQRQFEDAIENAGAEVRQQIIWNKSVFTFGRQDYQWKHELCFYGWKPGGPHYFVQDRTQSTIWELEDLKKMSKEQIILLIMKENSTVWDFDKPSASRLHPTMKPVPLIGKSVLNSTRKGETVLDLFGGSGSTLIACEELDRRCRMMEFDPHYCDVIIDRWETLTGKKAELIG